LVLALWLAARLGHQLPEAAVAEQAAEPAAAAEPTLKPA
jgi:hypothetical protein